MKKKGERRKGGKGSEKVKTWKIGGKKEKRRIKEKGGKRGNLFFNRWFWLRNVRKTFFRKKICLFSLKGTNCKKRRKRGNRKGKRRKKREFTFICWFQFTKQNLFFEKISYFFP